MASMMRRRANSSRLRIPAWDRPKDEVDLRTKVRGKRVSCLRGANPSPQLLSLFLMTRDRSPRPGRAAHSRLAFREGIFDSIRDARRITIERRECLVSRRARGTPGWVVPNLESAKSTTRGDCAAKGGRCAPRRCSLSELKLRPPEKLRRRMFARQIRTLRLVACKSARTIHLTSV